MKKRFLFIALSLLITDYWLPVTVFAEPPVKIRGIRPLGMGGALITVADDQNAFLYNPAGITQREKHLFTLWDAPTTVTSDVIPFVKFFKDNWEKLQEEDIGKDLMEEIIAEVSKFKIHLSQGIFGPSFISGPHHIDWQSHLNWGVGFFNLTEVKIKVNSGILVPTLDLQAKSDALLSMPVAYQTNLLPFGLPGELSAGVNLKCVGRLLIDERKKSLLELIKMVEELSSPIGYGFGLDLGTLYSLGSWKFGLVAQDLFGTAIREIRIQEKGGLKGVIPARLNLGIGFQPQKIYYWPGKYFPIKGLLFALDINNLFPMKNDEERNKGFFTRVYMGMEYRWKLLRLRTGFNQGYGTIGIGIATRILSLEYACYADELGKYPGQLPERAHIVSLSLHF